MTAAQEGEAEEQPMSGGSAQSAGKWYDLSTLTSMIPIVLGTFFVGGQLLTVWFLSRFSISPSDIGLSQLDSIVAAATLSIPGLLIVMFSVVVGHPFGAYVYRAMTGNAVANAIGFVGVCVAGFGVPALVQTFAERVAESSSERAVSALSMAISVAWVSVVAGVGWGFVDQAVSKDNGARLGRVSGWRGFAWLMAGGWIALLSMGSVGEAIQHEADLVEQAWINGRPDPLPFGYLLPRPVAVASDAWSCVLVLGEGGGTATALVWTETGANVERVNSESTTGSVASKCVWAAAAGG